MSVTSLSEVEKQASQILLRAAIKMCLTSLSRPVKVAIDQDIGKAKDLAYSQYPITNRRSHTKREGQEAVNVNTIGRLIHTPLLEILHDEKLSSAEALSKVLMLAATHKIEYKTIVKEIAIKHGLMISIASFTQKLLWKSSNTHLFARTKSA